MFGASKSKRKTHHSVQCPGGVVQLVALSHENLMAARWGVWFQMLWVHVRPPTQGIPETQIGFSFCNGHENIGNLAMEHS